MTKKPPKPKRWTLTDEFLSFWNALPEQRAGLPEPAREFLFSRPSRLWRLDLAWEAAMVAVELEGGIWSGGGHGRGKIYAGNCEKYNAAALKGWLLLRYTTKDIEQRPVQMIEEVCGAIKARWQVLPLENVNE